MTKDRFLRVAKWVLLGAATGILIFFGSRLPMPALFGILGAAAGLVVGLLLIGRRRAMRLTEVTVSVPQLSQMRFAVTQESQLVAWKLFVELLTRVSAQPLHDGQGRVESALTSLFGLLGFVRGVLQQNVPSPRTGRDPTVEQLALMMVINDLRPFVTAWNQRFSDWRGKNPGAAESEWPLNDECRADLAALQRNLRTYVRSFGELACVPNVAEIMGGAIGGHDRIPVSGPV
jgi:hypothetical protein